MIEPVHSLSLAGYTHYKIGGTARDVYFPENAREMLSIIRNLKNSATKYFILGRGSNVLIGDGFWDGAVILTIRMNSFSAYDTNLACGAGLTSTAAAETALGHEKTGLEFLYLLPGTIGGALAGNARYDNINISAALLSLEAVHPELGIRTFKTSEIHFDYKYTSIARESWIICTAALAWAAGDSKSIRKRMEDIEKARLDSHHFDYPSCGCVFKNDYTRNIQVGRLIDSLGLKGASIGGAKVAEFHGNFIINTGNATARNVLELIELVEIKVFERTGIRLEREVHILGTFEKGYDLRTVIDK